MTSPLVDAAWLRARLGSVVVADVRWYLDGRSGRAAYDGGHIPGAHNAPWTDNVANGRLKPPRELADRYRALGAGAGPVVYCGSGVNACHDLLALRHAGLPDGVLYAGSWSDWSSDPAREARTGALP